MKLQNRNQLKQRLSVTKLGKTRFWLGIVLGTLSAILFYGFIFFILETVDLFKIVLNFDFLIKNVEQLRFEKLFLLALSIAFGNNTMLRFWFSKPSEYLKKSYKYTTTRIVNYSLFIEYVVLFGALSFITRFLMYMPFLDHNLFKEYGYILYLFPVYLFYIAWTEISRYVKSQQWMLKTFAFSIVLLALLSFIDISKYKIGETAYKKMHKEELIYIENETEKAKRDYNIVFSEETINILKELRTERAFDLLKKSRLAFKTDGKVSLDTIILEKILIHNFKGYYIDELHSYLYTFPFQVYEQLRKVDSKSNEATELLNIIEEFYKLSLMMVEVPEDSNNSQLYYNKLHILEFDFHSENINWNYQKMYTQSSFLVYHMQRLGIYNHHPFFNTDIPFPQPLPIPDGWIKGNFPEFKDIIN
ncbi:hypothetical protein [Kordia sp.]|uniref:hypothetical protein n=1 Tax=Kordia sp. TaxID=1965332 RepID=UPI003B5BA65F